MESVLSFNNPAFKTYAFYGSILIMKVLLMALLTTRQRLTKKMYASREDIPFLYYFHYLLSSTSVNPTVGDNDPDIRRVLRAHLNDLENIPLFLFVAVLYLMTEPAEAWASNLIRLYAFTRIFHSLVYAVWVVPQPARGISWVIGYIIIFYMAFCVVGFCL